MTAPYKNLPEGIRTGFVDNGNGLHMHYLEAGAREEGRPCLLLLHGFPELSYSWRKVMLPLAEMGFHVLAPDQRGYGRTTGWQGRYEDPIAPFSFDNLSRDAAGFVQAMGYKRIACVIGHDFGSPIAGTCALKYPEIFASVVLMSSPLALPATAARPAGEDPVYAELARLPRPRKHYQLYYSTAEADGDMLHAPQGLHDFLRAYYYHKSADWPANRPHRLTAWEAEVIAEMPTYYIMELAETMAETVAKEMPDQAYIDACQWLPDDELAVYSETYGEVGFQGGLQWYRCNTGGENARFLSNYAGQTIEQPAMFLSGAQDWGSYQFPGALEEMSQRSFANMKDVHLVDGAGHWVQQEQPAAVVSHLKDFLVRAGQMPA